MFSISAFLAQISPQEILESQYDIAVNMSEIFRGLRTEILTGQAFFATSTLGAIIAVPSIGWYITETIRKRSRDPDAFDAQEWLPAIGGVILIVLLLGNPTGRGALLARWVDGGASLMDSAANWTLEVMSLNLNTDVIQAATIEAQAEMMMDSGIARCAEVQEEGKRDDCLIAVQDQVRELVDPFSNTGDVIDENGNNVGGEWAGKIYRKAQDRIVDHLTNKNANYESNWVARTFTNISFPDVSELIIGFLWVIASIFGYVQQIGVLLMATVSPIFLGLQLSPLHRGAFKEWATKFIGLGLFKIIFYVFASTAAWASLLSDVDSVLFPTIVALGSLAFSWQILSGSAAGILGAPAIGAATIGAAAQGARSLIRSK